MKRIRQKKHKIDHQSQGRRKDQDFLNESDNSLVDKDGSDLSWSSFAADSNKSIQRNSNFSHKRRRSKTLIKENSSNLRLSKKSTNSNLDHSGFEIESDQDQNQLRDGNRIERNHSPNPQNKTKAKKNGAIEKPDIFEDSLSILNGASHKDLYSRNYRLVHFFIRHIVLSSMVTFFYNIPLVALAAIQASLILEIYSGVGHKVYDKGVYNVGLIVEGIIFLVFGVTVFLIFLLNGSDSNGQRTVKGELVGWFSIGIIILGIMSSLMLKFSGRGKI